MGTDMIDSYVAAADDNDILEAALGAELATEPLYVERWKKWVTVQEMPGDERSDLLEKCTIIEKKNGKNVGRNDLKKLYPMLAILSIRNPIPTDLPDRKHPHYKEYPGATDENGNVITPAHPKAGQAPFTLAHLRVLGKKGGAALEQVAQVANRLSALRPEDIETKKDDSAEENTENEDSTTE